MQVKSNVETILILSAFRAMIATAMNCEFGCACHLRRMAQQVGERLHKLFVSGELGPGRGIREQKIDV